MANIRDLRQRITSVGNIQKITRAMEMVATTKLRRFQEAAVAAKPYSEELEQARQFETYNEEYRHRNMSLVLTAGAFHPVLMLISGVAMVLVTWLGALEVIAARMTIGDFVAFGFYQVMLIWPMIAMDRVYEIGSSELPAPQAGLMALMAQGIVGGEMAWPLVISGMALAGGMILINV